MDAKVFLRNHENIFYIILIYITIFGIYVKKLKPSKKVKKGRKNHKSVPKYT